MPFNWVAVEALANACLVLTSGGAISYAAIQLRHEREYRSVTNLEKQLSFFLSEKFASARRRLAEVRLVEREGQFELVPWELDEPPVSAFGVLDFYEHLALLVKKGHLDVYDVWHTFYEWMQPVYVDLKPMIEDPQSAYFDHYNDLQRLMKDMDAIQIGKMHKKQANHWALWTADRIIEHYRYELESTGQPMRRSRVRDVSRGVVKEKEPERA
jgi:hypothetical protein